MNINLPDTVNVGTRAFIVLLTAQVLSPILATVAGVQIAEHNMKEVAATQARQDEQIAETSRMQSCALFARLLDVYEETPPTTPAGQNVRRAYLTYYNDVRHCEPKRK